MIPALLMTSCLQMQLNSHDDIFTSNSKDSFYHVLYTTSYLKQLLHVDLIVYGHESVACFNLNLQMFVKQSRPDLWSDCVGVAEIASCSQSDAVQFSAAASQPQT